MHIIFFPAGLRPGCCRSAQPTPIISDSLLHCARFPSFLSSPRSQPTSRSPQAAMSVACASLAGGWEIGPGLALGCLFTEAELAVADQLVQLSGSGGGDEAASGSESESPRSVNTCAADAAWEEREEVVAGLGLGTMELDRRARKRYRLLSDVYAATRPVTGADAGSARKRKRGHEAEAEVGTTIRYDGDQCF